MILRLMNIKISQNVLLSRTTNIHLVLVHIKRKITGNSIDRRRTCTAFNDSAIHSTVWLRVWLNGWRTIHNAIDRTIDGDPVPIHLNRNWVRHIDQLLAVQAIRFISHHKTLL